MKYYLYNSLANNGIRPELKSGAELVDAVGLDYPEYLKKLSPEDEVVLIGGDGTLNYFINAVKDTEIKNRIYLLGSGTGNDFLKDIERQPGEEVLIDPYLSGLPTVRVNGLEKRFINNMGFGIDGYCCEVADRIKEKSPQEKIDYTGIAVKGLLFHFKPCHAEITVDGVKHEFDHVSRASMCRRPILSRSLPGTRSRCVFRVPAPRRSTGKPC